MCEKSQAHVKHVVYSTLRAPGRGAPPPGRKTGVSNLPGWFCCGVHSGLPVVLPRPYSYMKYVYEVCIWSMYMEALAMRPPPSRYRPHPPHPSAHAPITDVNWC